MRNILILIFAITSSTCLGQGNLKELEKAYKKKSINLYDNFLQKWEADSKPFKTIDSLDLLKKDIYSIFIDFYNPFVLKRIGTGERGNKLYSKIDYVIIQNTIFINIFKTDSLNFHLGQITDTLIQKKDSIMDFRPEIEFEEAKTLFLLPEYKIIINKFLGSKNYPLGFGGIMNPSRARGKSAKRLDFLNQKLKIIHGHWGGYWHIETHPRVYSIDFNKDRTIAKVNYRLGYEGGEAIYIYKNGSWELENARLIWIE